MLERAQLLCAVGVAEAEGDEVELFTSSCQLRFKLLSHIREGTNSLGGAAAPKEVCCEPPVVKIFGSSKEGSEFRVRNSGFRVGFRASATITRQRKSSQ